MYRGIVKLLCACTLFTLTIGCTTTVGRTDSDTLPLLSAKEVYDRISPSLAFVYTPLGSGSGALMDDGYILTNAHVVWPYSQVGVTFAEGTALKEVPVAFIDLIGDLALLGPVDVDVAAVTFVPRKNVEIGSDVYLIGYPGESEAFPKPTITRGILSRIREWTRIGLTFFQTDAAIAGGQSGGVLVTDRGEVIGISSLSMGGDNFALAASVEDVLQRLERMTSGVDVSGLDLRELSYGEESTTHEFTLENVWDTGVYVAVTAPGSAIDLTARSDLDIALYILDRYGDTLGLADDLEGGMTETLYLESQQDFHYVIIEPMVEGSGEVLLESNQPLARISDPDDARELEVGHSYTANLDFPFDYDWFVIDLQQGQKVTVEVESVMIDPYVCVDMAGVSTPVEDDDSGGGVLGLNSSLTFQATTAGKHTLVVSDAEGYWTGGYVIEIDEASPELVAQTFIMEDQSPDAETETLEQQGEKIDDPETVRQWRKYFGFAPEGWKVDTELFQQMMGPEVAVQFGGGLWTGFGYDPNITVALIPIPISSVSAWFVNMLVEAVKNTMSGTEVVSREEVTIDSVPGEWIKYNVDCQQMTMRLTQVYLFRDDQLWLLQCASIQNHSESELCFDLLRSFHFPEDLEGDIRSFGTAQIARGFFDRITGFYGSGDMKRAEDELYLFTRFAESLDPEDPEYAEAIASIGALYVIFGRHNLAADYLDRAESAFAAGDNLAEMGKFLNNAAWDLYLSGRYREGEPLARRSISIYSKAFESDNSSTVAATHTLAMLLVGLEQYDEAEGLLRKALAFQERKDGPDHENTVGYLTDLSTLLTRAGKKKEAEEISNRISRLGTLPPDWASEGGVLPAEQ